LASHIAQREREIVLLFVEDTVDKLLYMNPQGIENGE